MSESSVHTTLVRLLAKQIDKLLPPEDRSRMLVDVPENPPQKKPPRVYGFVPDVFVFNTTCYAFVIGEAKTAIDIDKNHTMEQLTAFLRKCSESSNSILVMAVPWHVVSLTKSVIWDCKEKADLETVRTMIIERLPG